MEEEYYVEQDLGYEDDDSDLRNYCACCGADFRTDAHDDRACAESQN